MSNSILVKVEDLDKSYLTGQEKISIFESMDLELPAGQITALYGPSGSGKSTLLHLLGGLDRPDRGTIIVDGKELNSLSDDGLAVLRQQTISYVFQFHHLLVDFTALENILIPLMIRKMPYHEAYKSAEQFLQLVGLSGRENHKPGELSGGERQRIAIVRALVTQPKLVLADEPTGNLDLENASKLLKMIEELCRTLGQTFLIATHDPEIASIADQRLHIKNKRISRLT